VVGCSGARDRWGGFIGSHLVEALVERGASVRALVRYTSRGGLGALDLLDQRTRSSVDVVHGDLCRQDVVGAVFDGVSVAFHLGALISIRYSYQSPDEVRSGVSMRDESFWTSRRVMVGGGCGFVGSYLVPELVEAGARVTVVDNLESGELASLDTVQSRIRFVQGDLKDPRVSDAVTRDQDVVLNLAATVSGVGYSHRHHGEMLTQNLLSALVPLDAARVNRVPRYLVVSSSCVYPQDAAVPTPETNQLDGAPETVNAGYAWAKRVYELAGEYYARDYGMQITVLRPFNIYGGRYRWRSAEKTHVIPALVQRVVDGEDPLVVWGSGRQSRNFLHGLDVARLMMICVERDVHGRPVNLGFETETSVAELVGLICEAAGRRPRVVYDSTKPEGQLRRSADATVLRDVTGGYEPSVTIQDGITEVVECYRRHKAAMVPGD
jgi:nucleoside-diphosphate-sugar epimerase